MANTPRIGAGLDVLFYGVLDTSGRLIGNTATGATNGTIQGLARLEGARTLPLPNPENARETVSGDNKPLVQFEWPGEELPNGVFEMAVQNLGFNALVQGEKVATVGGVNMGGAGSSTDKPDMMLLAERQAKKWTPGARGSKAWEGKLALKTQITPLGADIQQRQFSPYRYSVVSSESDRIGFGATFTEVLHGYTSKPILDIESDYAIHAMGGFGDGATVAYTLDYTPQAATSVYVYINNVLLEYGVGAGKYTVSGKTITFGTAPANAAHIGVLYEVQDGQLS